MVVRVDIEVSAAAVDVADARIKARDARLILGGAELGIGVVCAGVKAGFTTRRVCRKGHAGERRTCSSTGSSLHSHSESVRPQVEHVARSRF